MSDELPQDEIPDDDSDIDEADISPEEKQARKEVRAQQRAARDAGDD